jgi:hypothetical protein
MKTVYLWMRIVTTLLMLTLMSACDEIAPPTSRPSGSDNRTAPFEPAPAPEQEPFAPEQEPVAPAQEPFAPEQDQTAPDRPSGDMPTIIDLFVAGFGHRESVSWSADGEACLTNIFSAGDPVRIWASDLDSNRGYSVGLYYYAPDANGRPDSDQDGALVYSEFVTTGAAGDFEINLIVESSDPSGYYYAVIRLNPNSAFGYATMGCFYVDN